MYLRKKHYVKNWAHDKPEHAIAITVKKGGKKHEGINTKKICYIEEEVAYWRKANQIHEWFVQNAQDGTDDCREAYVSIDQLTELYAICERIIKECPLVKGTITNGYNVVGGKETPILEDGKVMTNFEVAKKLLPSTSGFFFGSTDYDEYYMQDIIQTRDTLKEEIAIENNRADYYYHSSW